MLDPEYLLEIADGAEEIAGMLHEEVLRVIVRRIVARLERAEDYLLTASDRWALDVLQEAGYLREELIETIARLTKLETKEVRKAFEEAGVTALEKDAEVYRAAGLSPEPLKQSPHLVRLMQRGYDKTMGEWSNLTGTLADAAQQLFISQCDRAYHLVSTGAESYQTAVRKAVEAIARDGVRITYPSGHTDTVETATLRAVRTGVAQATADITLARMDEFDWDLLKVDAHIGARTGDGGENYTNHYWWQGKIYSRSGRDKRYPPFSVCNLGHVQGICGANCRHGFGPSNEVDEDDPPYDSEENQKLYDLQQEQRRRERNIRHTKREAMALKEGAQAAEASGDADTAAELRKSYEKKAVLLQKQNRAYNDFCAENGLKRQQDRLHIAGWDKSQASAASAAARKGNKALESGKQSDIIATKRNVAKKINDRGEVVNPMPTEEYAKIKAALNKQGVEVFAATSGDDFRYMKALGAEGTYSNGRITHIGETPSRGTLYEEIIHMSQAKKYGELSSTDYVELYSREIEANRKLLRNSEKYKLDEIDVADIRRNLAVWEELYKKVTGVFYDEKNNR